MLTTYETLRASNGAEFVLVIEPVTRDMATGALLAYRDDGSHFAALGGLQEWPIREYFPWYGRPSVLRREAINFLRAQKTA